MSVFLFVCASSIYFALARSLVKRACKIAVNSASVSICLISISSIWSFGFHLSASIIFITWWVTSYSLTSEEMANRVPLPASEASTPNFGESHETKSLLNLLDHMTYKPIAPFPPTNNTATETVNNVRKTIEGVIPFKNLQDNLQLRLYRRRLLGGG